MKKVILVLIAILGILTLCGVAFSPREVIVKLNSSRAALDLQMIPALNSWLSEYGISKITPVTSKSANQFYVIETDQEIPLAEIESKRDSFSQIEYIQPNYLNEQHGTVNDPLFNQQRHKLCEIAEAWVYTTGDEDIIIAVVDSGILYDHPDLMNVIFKNENEVPNSGVDDDNNGYIDDYRGWDFTDAPTLHNIALGDYTVRDNDASDENFHGTHVSGIIGAEVNNGIGIAGVLWNVRILPVRAGFRTASGGGYLQDDDVSAAIIYATDMGANIINMSWGSPQYSPIIADACQYAYDRGVILVASAGNDPGPFISYPAKLSTVISVGSINEFKTISSFSSYGPELDIVAPGSDILSTYSMEGDNTGYTQMSGTSMSSPYAAGIIGLLLAQRPGITFEEVKALLYSTAEHLPLNSIETGFNEKYGYGLINAYNLLSTYSAPDISISYPYEEMGQSSSFPIKGSITIDDFFRYSVTYSPGNETGNLVWLDCQTHRNIPEYVKVLPEDGVLHNFNVYPEFQDGNYRIRLSVQNSSGKVFNILRNVYIDKSLPNPTKDFELVTRYKSTSKAHYLKCHFNENVDVTAKIYDSNNQLFHAFSNVPDSVLFVALPNTLSNGLIDVEIEARNRSGLIYNSGLLTEIGSVNYNSTPINKFDVTPFISTNTIPTKKYLDFDGNGKNEFIAMTIEEGSFGEVNIYEKNGTELIIKHTFKDQFRPLDIGNTNTFGNEILGLRLETLYIYETYAESNYPHDSYIQSIANGSGGIFADYNNNGRDDLICVVNEPAQSVIQLLQRQSQGFTEKGRLLNTSPTFARNTFVPWIKCADLDGDNFPDILTADTDGDVMIYEMNPAVENHLSWSYRLDVRNAYYLDYGDITGDGRNEFIVGGYTENLENMNSTYFKFFLFKSDANNSYQILDTISFDSVGKNNSLVIFDSDNDGKDEIYLSLTPYLYKLEYLDGKLTPTAVHNSRDSFQISIYQEENNSQPLILCNQLIDGEIQTVYLSARDFANEPEVPNNFHAVPRDEHTAKLTWDADGVSQYKIYRLYNDIQEVIFQTSSGEFLDENLVTNEEYKYAVSTFNASFTNPESFLTVWKSVTPNEQPQIINVKKISDYYLEVKFNVSLANEMIQIGHYSIDQGIGNPHSVILDSHFKRAILRLREGLTEPEYTLTCSQVISRNEIIAEELTADFTNLEDVIAPVVELIEIINKQQVKLIFSENIYSEDFQPVTIDNFRLKNPANDISTTLKSIVHDNNEVLVNFSHELQYSNQPYKILINNIIDSNANQILPQLSTIHFNLTDITDLSKLVVYPNPKYLRTGKNEIRFTNFPLNSKGNISIYNKAGDLVFSKKVGPFYGNDDFSWNLNNNSGQRVSSGVYFYVINMGSSNTKGKIAILH